MIMSFDPEHPEKNIGIHMGMRVAKDVSYTNTMNTNNLILRVSASLSDTAR